MADVKVLTVRGKVSFAKVLNDQLSLNYSKDGKEWKFDILLDEDTVKEFKKLKIGDKIRKGEPYEKDGVEKPAYLGGRPFLTLRQSETKRDGNFNKPIEITDILGKAWDQTKELGNDTVVDAKIAIIDNGPGKKKGMYPRSIRVLEHVPYERKVFDDIDPSDPYYKAALEAQEKAKAAKDEVVADDFKKDFGLEDDLYDDIDL